MQKIDSKPAHSFFFKFENEKEMKTALMRNATCQHLCACEDIECTCKNYKSKIDILIPR